MSCCSNHGVVEVRIGVVEMIILEAVGTHDHAEFSVAIHEQLRLEEDGGEEAGYGFGIRKHVLIQV